MTKAQRAPVHFGGWFRAYNGIVDDPKVQRLAPHVFKGWICLLCLASERRGPLPDLDTIAFRLRMSPHDAEQLIVALMEVGLIEYAEVNGDRVLAPHNWQGRQWITTPSTDRVRKFRRRKHDETRTKRNGTVSETPETYSESVSAVERITTLASIQEEGCSYLGGDGSEVLS
jgi:hypothetical protein